LLRKLGYNSKIYALNINNSKNKVKKYNKYKGNKKNILIWHISTRDELAKFISNLPDRKIILYHNITPPRFFIGINNHLAGILDIALEELKDYKDMAELCLTDSRFSSHELDKIGFKNIREIPFLIDFNKYNIKINKILFEKYKDGYVNLLFVGRIMPNKKYEDLIKVFYYYKKYINNKSRLILVGDYNGIYEYYLKLKFLIKDLKLKDIIFTNLVDFKDLITYYKLADIFLCMSEHEGFCVPLVEAMYFRLPIIAYNSTAIPGTLNGSGILVNEKNYAEIAEMINLIVEDKNFREGIIESQNKRLEYFKIEKTKKLFEEELNNFLKKD